MEKNLLSMSRLWRNSQDCGAYTRKFAKNALDLPKKQKISYMEKTTEIRAHRKVTRASRGKNFLCALL